MSELTAIDILINPDDATIKGLLTPKYRLMARWRSACGSAPTASGRPCSCTSGASATASTSYRRPRVRRASSRPKASSTSRVIVSW